MRPGSRGNAVRWIIAPAAPARGRAMGFLSDLEDCICSETVCMDLAGLKAVRSLISNLEERLAVSQGANPLFPEGLPNE